MSLFSAEIQIVFVVPGKRRQNPQSRVNRAFQACQGFVVLIPVQRKPKLQILFITHYRRNQKGKAGGILFTPLASYTVILDSFHSKNRFLFISPSVTLTNDKPYRLLAARRKYSTNSYRLFRERPLIGEWATCYEHAFLLYFLPFLRKIAVFITRLCETRCFLKCIRRRWNRMPDSAHHTHRLQKRHPA